MSDAGQPVEAGGETKEQKFARLATKRTQAALTKIRLLSNLTGSSYRYSDDQANRIIAALRQAVNDLEGKFRRIRGQKMGSESFTL
jgi:ABC-type transporter Mla subunit MlaD